MINHLCVACFRFYRIWSIERRHCVFSPFSLSVTIVVLFLWVQWYDSFCSCSLSRYRTFTILRVSLNVRLAFEDKNFATIGIIRRYYTIGMA